MGTASGTREQRQVRDDHSLFLLSTLTLRQDLFFKCDFRNNWPYLGREQCLCLILYRKRYKLTYDVKSKISTVIC